MKVTCFALEPGGGLRPEAEATALARWRDGGGPYWIHLGADRPEAVAAWVAALGLDPELLELMQIGSDETRILPLDDLVFVAFPVPAGSGDREPDHVGLLCLDRLVVTVQRSADPLVGELPLARLRVREGTTAGVVCALMLYHAARLRKHVVALRREGGVLTDRMDADPWAVSLEEILAAKRRVSAVAAAVDEELAVLELMKASDRRALPLARLASIFQIAIEITRATDRDLDRLEGCVADLQRRREAALQERTNRRLGLLTVISAIFMPLTLIAGIYGMNFDLMPELHHPYGYPAVLAVMALIAGGLAWWFRSRWWAR